ncbi:DUF3060 domain-containing protein [Saccharopolyspora sp. NPDC000359]|uniref:DUF3060 domain-containing protein n=1 Tax=Saccharopolyspora sp. NPDC000359 TaxID=3154251 RepID=UPI00331F864F
MQVERLEYGSSEVRARGGAWCAAVLLAGAGLTALLVAGCGSGGSTSSDPSSGTSTSADEAAPLPVVDPVEEDEPDAGSEKVDVPGGAAPLIVRANGTALTEDCRSRKVVVLANDADLTLHGACSLVKVQGSNATVEVGSAQKIIAVGTGSTVHYATGQPHVVNKGDNDVSPGGAATP